MAFHVPLELTNWKGTHRELMYSHLGQSEDSLFQNEANYEEIEPGEGHLLARWLKPLNASLAKANDIP